MEFDGDRCYNQNEHNSHPVEFMVDKQCAGLGECGIYTHPPHPYSKLIKTYCPGICKCGDTMRGNPHGPGEHK